MILSCDSIIYMKPPFSISEEILNRVSDISTIIGKLEGLKLPEISIDLRRKNRIRTIYSSLVIEGNQLNKKQVTAVLDGKPVVGRKKDIQEVQNAIVAYDALPEYRPFSLQSFLSAHEILLKRCKLYSQLHLKEKLENAN